MEPFVWDTGRELATYSGDGWQFCSAICRAGRLLSTALHTWLGHPLWSWPALPVTWGPAPNTTGQEAGKRSYAMHPEPWTRKSCAWPFRGSEGKPWPLAVFLFSSQGLCEAKRKPAQLHCPLP